MLILLAALAIASCSSSSDQAPSPATRMPEPPKSTGYSASPADVPVGVIPAAMLHDAARNRDVEVSIDYPTKGGPFPLIVFSHDYGQSNRAYEQLVAYWTTRGYVVARPKHADAGAVQDAMHAIFAERPGDQKKERDRSKQPKKTSEEIRKERETAEMRERAEVWTKTGEPQWRDRAADVDLIVSSLDAIEAKFPELKGKIAHDKIGVAGHGLGAFTAMLLGGMRTSSLSAADARVRAVLAMSPQGIAANRGLTQQSWADVKVPAMFMTGTEDRGAAAGEDWQWRKAGFTNSPAGDKYFVLLDGGRHASFLGTYSPVDIRPTTSIPTTMRDPRDPYYNPQIPETQPRNGPINPQIGRQTFSDIRVVSLAFWDAYLKSDAKGKDFLATKWDLLPGVKVERR
jgi:predicted dienelactone hydrolase